MEQHVQEQYSSSFSGEIIFAILFICFIIYLIYSIISFKSERDYIKMEMGRSISEKELKYWQRELKRLYIRKIPIIGFLLLDDDD